MGEMGAESVQRQLSHKSLENDAVVGEDEEEFKTLEEVDEVLNKYTRFWQSRARKLRNQLSPTEEPTQLDQDVVAQKVAEVVPEPEDQLEPADSEEADVKSVDIPQRSTTIRLKKSSSEETFAKQYGGVHQRSKSVSFAEPMDIFLNLKRKRATSASGFLENTSSRYHQSQKALNLEHDRPGDPLSEKMVPSLRKSNEGSTVVSSRSISRKSSAYKVKASKEMKKGSAGSKTKSPQSTKAELKDDVRSRRSSPKLQSRTQSADDRSSSLRRSPQQNQSDRDGNSKIFPFKDLFIEDEFLRADPHRPSSRVSMAMARNVEKEALDGFVTDWWLQPDGYSTEASKAPKKTTDFVIFICGNFTAVAQYSTSPSPRVPWRRHFGGKRDIYHHSCDPNKPVVYDEVAYQDRQQKGDN
ncbi:hypothetical protein BC829DRAFT_93636 [Chytridium lagenaria]|nr:hypothetical protein BC829DRAFT_93636 [Chytridium lagenaria]